MSQDEKGADVASQLDHAEQGYAKVNVEAAVPSPNLGAPEVPAASSKESEGPSSSPSKERTLLAEVEEELEREFHAFEHGYMVFWRRFIGVGKKKVGWLESLRNMVMASCAYPGISKHRITHPRNGTRDQCLLYFPPFCLGMSFYEYGWKMAS